jgi:hypothetical protein
MPVELVAESAQRPLVRQAPRDQQHWVCSAEGVDCGVAVGEVADVPSNNYRRESEEK